MARKEPAARPKRKSKAKTEKGKARAAAKAAGPTNQRPATRGEEESFVIWAGKARRQLSLVRKAADVVQSEKGILSNIYTAAKEAGLSAERVRVMKMTLKRELREPTEVIAEGRELAFQAKALDSPLVQLGLFDGLLKEPTVAEWELIGEHAGRNGESIDSGAPSPGTAQHVHFVSGWKKGQKANADKLAADMGAKPKPDDDGAILQ